MAIGKTGNLRLAETIRVGTAMICTVRGVGNVRPGCFEAARSLTGMPGAKTDVIAIRANKGMFAFSDGTSI